MLGLYRPAKPAGDCGDAAESDPTVQAFTVQQNFGRNLTALVPLIQPPLHPSPDPAQDASGDPDPDTEPDALTHFFGLPLVFFGFDSGSSSLLGLP